MNLRIMIRGYLGRDIKFKQPLMVENSEFDNALEHLAAAHAKALAAGDIDMIEFEFLDEPDPNERYFRMGTKPTGMVAPMRVNLAGGDPS
jgi:hypothetical protein